MCDDINNKSCCANCNRGLDRGGTESEEEKVSKIKVNLRIAASSSSEKSSLLNSKSSTTLQELSVYEALSTVYNFKSFDEYENHHHHEKVDKDADLFICRPCSINLTQLYQNYQELDLVRQVGSYMTEKLQRLEQHIINNFHDSSISPCQTGNNNNKNTDDTTVENSKSQNETDLQGNLEPEEVGHDDDDDDEPEILAVKPELETDEEENSDDDPLSIDPPTPKKPSSSLPVPTQGPAVKKRFIIVRRRIGPTNNNSNQTSLITRSPSISLGNNWPNNKPLVVNKSIMPSTSFVAKTAAAATSSNYSASNRTMSRQPTPPSSSSAKTAAPPSSSNSSASNRTMSCQPTPPSSSAGSSIEDRLRHDSERSEKFPKKLSGPPYKCPVCFHPIRYFTTESSLLQHLVDPGPAGHNKKPASCDCSPCEMDNFLRVVSMYFEKAGDYKDAYERGDPTVKSYQLLTFKLRETSVHVVLTKPAPYTCPFQDCGIVYKNSKLFINHLRTFHLLEGSTCTKCSKKFRCAKYLRLHLKRCGENKKGVRRKKYLTPFICVDCNKQFNHKCAYERHRTVHTTELNVQCDVCGKGFKNMLNLRSHMIVHSNLRPAVCPQCGKTYKSRSQLSFHEKISHTEEGRLKYNEYMRMKNRRKKLEAQQQQKRQQQQQEGDGGQEEQECDNVSDTSIDVVGQLPLEDNDFANINFSELV